MADAELPGIDPANTDQFKAWDQNEGVFWAENAAVFERSVHRYDDPLFQQAGIRDGDCVLDVGCGTGGTTIAAARLAGSGAAVGVDLSSPMLAVGTEAAAKSGVGNASFLQADAQVYPFPAESFDVVLSRTGCMFFADPIAAFTNLGRSLKPGGRVVLLVWQSPARNSWFTELATALAVGRDLPSPPPEVPSPFAFADPARVGRVLTAAGLTAPEYESIEELMYFGPDLETAEHFVLGVLGWLVEPATRAQAMANLRTTLQSRLTAEGVAFPSATWLVTSRKPAPQQSVAMGN